MQTWCEEMILSLFNFLFHIVEKKENPPFLFERCSFMNSLMLSKIWAAETPW